MKKRLEPQLKPLTHEEKLLLPHLEKILLSANKLRPILNDDILYELNKVVSKLKDEGHDIKPVSSSRLRKMINNMRVNSTLPIISNSKGYFVSYDNADIAEMIVSLKWRSAAILEAAYGLQYIIKQKELDDSFLKGIELKEDYKK